MARVASIILKGVLYYIIIILIIPPVFVGDTDIDPSPVLMDIVSGDSINPISTSRAEVTVPDEVWIQRGLPSARSEHALVFDSDNDKLYMYGGWDLSNELSDLWQFEIATEKWSEVNDGKNPGDRHDHSMVYMDGKNSFYLFGGFDSDDMQNDMWMFDITSGSWELVNDGTGTAPSPRRGMGIACDSSNGYIFVFGGYDGSTYLDDVWLFDITEDLWSEMTVSGSKPQARSNMAMALDPDDYCLYMFGGFDGTVYRDDFMKLDLTAKTWSTVPPGSFGSPPSRSEHTMVFETGNGRAYLFGGIYLTYSDVKEYRADFWYFDVDDGNWYQPEDGAAPGPRARHAMAIDTNQNHVYIMQGYSGSFREDLWRYRIGQNDWDLIYDSSPVQSPSIRNGQGLIFDHVTNSLFYFGGYYNDGQPHYREDMWRFDLGTQRWELVNEGTGPHARFARGVVFDENHHEIYVFGGYYYDFYAGTRNYLNDMWVYNITTDSWSEIDDGTSVPSPRDGHTMIFDPGNDTIYLHGGRKWISGTTYEYYGDLWVYDTATRTWTDLTDSTTITPRSRQAMCFDKLRADIYVFGGYNDTGYNNEVWKYNIYGNNWSLLTTGGTVPTPRGAHGLVYDVKNDDIYLLSGKNQDSPENIIDDFYIFDVGFQSWTFLDLSGLPRPDPRIQYGFVYDTIRDRLILSGGYYFVSQATFLADLWEYEPDMFKWEEVLVKRPYPESCVDGKFASLGGNILIFGGWDGERYLNDLWSYNMNLDEFSDYMAGQTGQRPPARRAHGLVAYISMGPPKLYLFGGNDGTLLDDFWEFDARDKQWTELAPVGGVKPSARERFPMVNARYDKIYLHGGWNGTSRDDLWRYDPDLNQWTELNPSGTKPSARQRHSLVLDRSNGYLYLFGGFDKNIQYKNDLWRYDILANTWTEITGFSGSAPSPRDSHGMAYDSDLDAILIFGGKDGTGFFDDIYAYDIGNSVWIKLDSGYSSPSPRHSFGYTFIEHNRTLFLYGGWSNYYKGDLWSFQVPQPGIQSIEVEFNDGDGPDNKTVYARYRPYEFIIKVKDAKSYKNLKDVIMKFATGHEVAWNQGSGILYEKHDHNNGIELTGDSYAEHDASKTWTLHFIIDFNWTISHETFAGPRITVSNNDDVNVNIFAEDDLFHIENDLDYYGIPMVEGDHQGALSQNDWVRKSEALSWTNLTVVYQGTTDVNPPEDEYRAAIWDDDGNVWYDTEPGPGVVFETTADATTDISEVYTFNITGIPPDSDNSSLTYVLKVDADPVIFSSPKPLSTELNNELLVECSIEVSDGFGLQSSGVDASTVEYSISTNGGLTWSSWTSAGASLITPAVRVFVKPTLENTFKNFIRWRGTDAVGNDLTYSEEYRVIVDTSYSTSAPTTMLLYPLSGAKLVTQRPLFAWIGVDPEEDPITYDIYIGNNEEAVRNRESSLRVSSGIERPFHEMKVDLDRSKKYYWTVIPHDEVYTGRCTSDVWNFTITASNESAHTTTLQSPDNYQLVDTLTPAFAWDHDISDITNTEFFIMVYVPVDEGASDLPRSGVPVAQVVDGAQKTYTPSSGLLQDNTTYEWIVIPKTDGVVGYCKNGPWQFKVDTTFIVNYKLEIQAPADYPIKPGQSANTSLTIKNVGNMLDSYELDLDAGALEGMITVESPPTDRLLTPGDSIKLGVTLSIVSTVMSGEYPVIFTVTSKGSGGDVSESATMTVKVQGDSTVTEPDEEEGLNTLMLAGIIAAVIMVVVVVIILFMMMSKKKKEEVAAAAAAGQGAAEYSYIMKDAFVSERGPIEAMEGAAGLPAITYDEYGRPVSPADTLPAQPAGAGPATALPQQIPASPYEGAVTEPQVTPPTPEGWAQAPQLPPSEVPTEQQPEPQEMVRYDIMESPPTEVPPPGETIDESREKQVDTIQPGQPAEPPAPGPDAASQAEEYQQPQQTIMCPSCGATNWYGQTQCAFCGNYIYYQ